MHNRFASCLPLLIALLFSPAQVIAQSAQVVINVLDPMFGAVGDGATDDTLHIQAAIDYAYEHHIQAVHITASPSGHCYRITSPLYLDQPGNLRSDLANPPFFNFSLSLIGDGQGNGEGSGANICPSFNNDVALWVGPGQDMRVSGISIRAPYTGAYRKQLPAAGCGICFGSNSGGPSRTLIDSVELDGFYTLIGTAQNGGPSVGDSNRINNSHLTNCYTAVRFGGTQNFDNVLRDNVFGYCTVLVDAALATPVLVSGGNYSTIGSVATSFQWTNVSLAGPGYIFKATLDRDDPLMDAGVYNAFTVPTAWFNVIPFTLVSPGPGVPAYDPRTRTGYFQIVGDWITQYYGISYIDPFMVSDLRSDIENSSKVFAAELPVKFLGNHFNISGIHVEETGGGAARLISADTGWGGPGNSTLTNIYGDNTDPALSSYGPFACPNCTDDLRAKYYAMQVFGYITIGTGGVTIENSQLGLIQDPVMLEFARDGSLTHNVVFRGSPAFLNFRAVDQLTGTGWYNSPFTSGLGSGRFDLSPWQGGVNGGGSPGAGGYPWFTSGWGKVPEWWGFRPAPWSRPCITPQDVRTLAGPLPPIMSFGSGISTKYHFGYPDLWGGLLHSVCDWGTLPQIPHYELLSRHEFFTIGQDLTTQNVPNLHWCYKGGSPFLSVNPELFGLVHAGLGIQLDNGSGRVTYEVTGVYPGLRTISTFGPLAGDPHTVYCGTTIGQQRFAVQYP